MPRIDVLVVTKDAAKEILEIALGLQYYFLVSTHFHYRIRLDQYIFSSPEQWLAKRKVSQLIISLTSKNDWLTFFRNARLLRHLGLLNSWDKSLSFNRV